MYYCKYCFIAKCFIVLLFLSLWPTNVKGIYNFKVLAISDHIKIHLSCYSKQLVSNYPYFHLSMLTLLCQCGIVSNILYPSSSFNLFWYFKTKIHGVLESISLPSSEYNVLLTENCSSNERPNDPKNPWLLIKNMLRSCRWKLKACVMSPFSFWWGLFCWQRKKIS